MVHWFSWFAEPPEPSVKETITLWRKALSQETRKVKYKHRWSIPQLFTYGVSLRHCWNVWGLRAREILLLWVWPWKASYCTDWHVLYCFSSIKFEFNSKSLYFVCWGIHLWSPNPQMQLNQNVNLKFVDLWNIKDYRKKYDRVRIGRLSEKEANLLTLLT